MPDGFESAFKSEAALPLESGGRITVTELFVAASDAFGLVTPSAQEIVPNRQSRGRRNHDG
jgi:hypothetical protein